jgi:uncharacterized protein (TIGR02246 family)
MEAERLIEAYFQAWISQDESRLAEFFAPDAVYSECYGPEYRGLTQIVYWFQDWNKRGRVTRWDILGSIRQATRLPLSGRLAAFTTARKAV